MFSSRFSFIGPDLFHRSVLEEALVLDQKNYDLMDQGTSLCFQWQEANKEIYFGVIDTFNDDKLIGYINALPVSADVINEVFNGYIRDVEIDPCLINLYEKPEVMTLFLTSIVIDEKFQGTSAILVLYEGFLRCLINLAQDRKIFFESIYANAVTHQGLLLAKKFGFKPIKTNRTGHYFKLGMSPLRPTLFNKTEEELRNVYSSVGTRSFR